MNRRYALGPGALLAFFALTGCQPVSATATYRSSAIILTPSPSIPDARKSVHTYKVTADVGTLVVDDKIGNVTITGRDRPGVEVMAFATYSSTPPDITRTVSGGTLTVGYICPAQSQCRVTFDIEVPTGIAVLAATDTGSIWLNGLAGAATAKAGAGYIFAAGLTGQTASFSTDAGGITAAFTSPPADVTATTVLGTIELQVPATVTYRMITNVVGAVTVTVPQSAVATRTITVDTNLGNVHVTPS